MYNRFISCATGFIEIRFRILLLCVNARTILCIQMLLVTEINANGCTT